jgi:hypothetical protein
MTANLYFASVGTLVQPSFAALLKLEMLDRVGDVNATSIHARLDQGLVKQKTRRPDERPAFPVFSISGLLADQHDLGFWRTFSKYGLGRVFPQRARLTGCRLSTQTLNLVVCPRADTHGLTKYSTRTQARMAKATLPMRT